MNKIFSLRHQNQYNLRNWTYFDISIVRTANHGSNSARYPSPKIWERILTRIKKLDTIGIFKVAIKMETRILSM